MSDFGKPPPYGVFEGTAWPRPSPTRKAASVTDPAVPHMADWTRDEIQIPSTYVGPGFHR